MPTDPTPTQTPAINVFGGPMKHLTAMSHEEMRCELAEYRRLAALAATGDAPLTGEDGGNELDPEVRVRRWLYHYRRLLVKQEPEGYAPFVGNLIGPTYDAAILCAEARGAASLQDRVDALAAQLAAARAERDELKERVKVAEGRLADYERDAQAQTVVRPTDTPPGVADYEQMLRATRPTDTGRDG